LEQTQETLDFCAEKNIASDIELIDIEDIRKAYGWSGGCALSLGDRYGRIGEVARLRGGMFLWPE
jgi:hypothetical protein